MGSIFLGDVATASLRRHGLLWPPNNDVYVPLLERSRGHVLMTGYDGDRLFDGWRYRSVVAGLGRRPTLDDARTLVSRFAPEALVAQRASRSTPSTTWLPVDVPRQLAESVFRTVESPSTGGVLSAGSPAVDGRVWSGKAWPASAGPSTFTSFIPSSSPRVRRSEQHGRSPRLAGSPSALRKLVGDLLPEARGYGLRVEISI